MFRWLLWAQSEEVLQVTRWADWEVNWSAIAGRGHQRYTGPSESGLLSVLNTAHYWDSSEDFPGQTEQLHTE